MSTLRYPPGAVVGDVLRGACGTLIVVGVLAAASLPTWLAALLIGCLALFLVFTAQSCVRIRRRYRVDAQGVGVEGAGTAVCWRDLDGLELGYYATRRDGHGGWMQLTLRGGGRKLRLDSRLEDFERVLDRSLAAAARRGLALAPATRANLQALGRRPPALPEAPP
jgi:hypothetical protein